MITEEKILNAYNLLLDSSTREYTASNKTSACKDLFECISDRKFRHVFALLAIITFYN
jgi:hypothetical protein